MTPLREPSFHWGRRLPALLQTEAAECGLVCVAMVASFFGHAIEPAELRRRFTLSLKGATMRDLVGIADALELASRPVRLELSELPLLKAPCILHWDLHHFVVLKKVSGSGVTVHDPAHGVVKMSLAEASRHFTGVALELTPTGRFKIARPKPRIGVRALLGNVVGLKRSLSELLVLALAIELASMAAPLFMAWVVDHALASADYDLLITLVIGFALLLLLRTTLSAMRGWVLMVLGASLKVQARANLFTHLLKLPASWFEARYLSDIMSRFGSQETILHALTTDLVLAIMDGLMCGLTLVLMFLFAPLLTLIAVAGALIYGILRWATYTPLRQASAESIVWSARQDGHFLESMRGIKTIKLFNANDERRTHWLNLLVEATNRQLITQRLQLVFSSANSFLLGSIAILTIWIGAREVLAKTFTIGLLVAFIAYKDQFLSRTSELINRLVDLRMLRLHAERLADIALNAPEPSHVPASPIRDDGFGLARAIEVRDLCFRYAVNDRWVLDHVSFRIDAGDSVALTGPSGGGKTTLLKLLAGLLQPTSGEIRIDGEPLYRFGAERYRAMIGVVMQDDQLFAGSIAENISFFSPHPDAERVHQCARMASVHDDILSMPMSYETLVGDMGTVLSGGQKQRVLIARALYREPAILLLDEATSHLDVDRERAVNAAIGNTATTRLIIAHRLETIRACNRAIVLEEGRVSGIVDHTRVDDVVPHTSAFSAGLTIGFNETAA